MHGNEHHVKNLHELRPDLNSDELANEIAESTNTTTKNNNS